MRIVHVIYKSVHRWKLPILILLEANLTIESYMLGHKSLGLVTPIIKICLWIEYDVVLIVSERIILIPCY